MRVFLAFLAVAAIGLVAGCGVSQEELSAAESTAAEDAYADGERAGKRGVLREAAEAREQGWEEGYEAGEEAAWELEEEFEEEELAELEGEEELNPYPLTKDGTPSYEFEADDIERAEEGYEDQGLREYCEGAVSEAQELGCLAHADPP